MAQHNKKTAKTKKSKAKKTSPLPEEDLEKLSISFIRKACTARIRGRAETAEMLYGKAYDTLPCFASAFSMAAHLQCTGKHIEAMRYYNEALAFLDLKTDPHSESRAIIFTAMASLHNKLKEHRKAVEYYKKALSIYESMKGEDERRIEIIATDVVANLADTYFILKEFEQAGPLYLCVLQIDVNAIQDDPEELYRNYALDVLNLARFFAVTGDEGLAEKFYDMSFNVYGKVAEKGSQSDCMAYARSLLQVAAMHREDYPNRKLAMTCANRVLKILPDCGDTVEAYRRKREAEAIIRELEEIS